VVCSPDEPPITVDWQSIRLTPRPFVRDIFISYAHEDKETAERLSKVLENRGWSVWWDLYISPGSKYRQTIERQLATARCVIVLWSTAANASDFVQDEAGHALDRGVLAPAKIEGVAPPIGFGPIQTADLTGWHGEENHEGLQRFLASIAARLKHPGSDLSLSENPDGPPPGDKKN
jgi:hypothetical protein